MGLFGAAGTNDYHLDPCHGYALSASPFAWGRICNYGMEDSMQYWQQYGGTCLGCRRSVYDKYGVDNSMNPDPDDIIEDSLGNFADLYSCVPPSGRPADASWYGANGEFIPGCPIDNFYGFFNKHVWAGRCHPIGVICDLTLLSTSTIVEPEWVVPFVQYNFHDMPGSPFSFIGNSGCAWLKIYKNTDDNRYIIIQGGPSLRPTEYTYAGGQKFATMSFGATITTTDRDYSAFFEACKERYPIITGECSRDYDPASWCTSMAYAMANRNLINSLPIGGVVEQGDKAYDEWPLSPMRSGTYVLSFSHGSSTASFSGASGCGVIDSGLSMDEIIAFYASTTDWGLPSLAPDTSGRITFSGGSTPYTPVQQWNNCVHCQETIDPYDPLTTGGFLYMSSNNPLSAFWTGDPTRDIYDKLGIRKPRGANIDDFGGNDIANGGSMNKISCEMTW